MRSIHFVGTPLVEYQDDNELVLTSRRRKVFNPLFVVGCILFIASMFLKANVDNRLAAIPLGISSLILLTGVWLLSANGKVIFSRIDKKVYRVYKHLGYVQKVYITPMQSIDHAVSIENKVHLQLDNMKKILISEDSVTESSNDLVARINFFIIAGS